MLREIQNVRQIDGEPKRRWFWDDYFELIVWFDDQNNIEMFELSYDMQANWRAIKWTPFSGARHCRVDDGESRPQKNAIPILTGAGEGPPPDLMENFLNRSGSVDNSIVAFVARHLGEFRTNLKAA